MTRREFLKTLISLSIAGSMKPVISYAEALNLAKEDLKGAEVFVTGCMWCQSGCSMLVYIKNGRLIHVTGNPDDPVTKGKICIKPIGTIQILNSSERLKYPLKRVGEKLVKISWDEALDEIAYHLKELRRKFGGEVLGIWASGRSAFDGRLVSKAFAKLYGTPNWEKTGPFCNFSGKIAGLLTTGTPHTPWIYEDGDFYSADFYMFVGSNMAETRPVIFANLLEEKRKRNCFFVCVDPRKTTTAKYSDMWLPVRPGTDMALGLAMIYHILKKGLEDKEFIKKYTAGFEKFKKELLERGYSPEWASGITGIPADLIKKLAERYASTEKAIIVGNSGLSHHTNSVQTHRVFYFLSAITGHFGRPSCGYACLNNGGAKIGEIPIPRDACPKTRPALGKNPVDWFKSLEDPEYPYKLKAFISTGSPLTQWPQQEKIRNSLKKLELTVWNGVVPSVNVRYFKYILPAAVWIEAGTIAPVSDDSRFVLVPKLINAPGEAKPDRWWWVELARKMGWSDYIPEYLKDHEKIINFACGRFGFAINDFLKEKNTHALRYPKGRRTLFINGSFHTKDKKFHFDDPSHKLKVYGIPEFPEFYTDPDIAKKGEKILKPLNKLIKSPLLKNKYYTKKVKLIVKKEEEKRFPLNLITGRPSRAIMGDATHWSKLLSSFALNQICLIHPETAKKFGIKDRKKVKIISKYGEAVCLAVLFKGIRKDTVFVPYSFGENQPFSSWKPINFVIGAEVIEPISGQIAFKGEKVTLKCVE